MADWIEELSNEMVKELLRQFPYCIYLLRHADVSWSLFDIESDDEDGDDEDGDDEDGDDEDGDDDHGDDQHGDDVDGDDDERDTDDHNGNRNNVQEMVTDYATAQVTDRHHLRTHHQVWI